MRVVGFFWCIWSAFLVFWITTGTLALLSLYGWYEDDVDKWFKANRRTLALSAVMGFLLWALMFDSVL